MTNHPGDSEHRYKHHPKKPKPAKCRKCLIPFATKGDAVRKGGSRYHRDCL